MSDQMTFDNFWKRNDIKIKDLLRELYDTAQPDDQPSLKEWGRKQMLMFEKLIAYVESECGEYEFNGTQDNYFVYYDTKSLTWKYGIHTHEHLMTVYMWKELAIKLVKKLNSREVIL